MLRPSARPSPQCPRPLCPGSGAGSNASSAASRAARRRRRTTRSVRARPGPIAASILRHATGTHTTGTYPTPRESARRHRVRRCTRECCRRRLSSFLPLEEIANVFPVTVSRRLTRVRRPTHTRCRRRSTARCSDPLRRATGWRRLPRSRRRRARYAGLQAQTQLLPRHRRRHGRRRYGKRVRYRSCHIMRLDSLIVHSAQVYIVFSVSEITLALYLTSSVFLLRTYLF
jgi:hypothetical protein